MAATRTGHVVPDAGDGDVRECPLELGPEGNLIGILARPAAAPDAGRAIVIFLNAGVIHRVGPHRLHVKLARALAARGTTSLRLDLSGIGDSRTVPGSLSFRQSAVADTRLAMDRVAADTGATRFLLFGLCSGADNALATAEVDERVAGIVVLDPPAYVTPRAQARKLAARVRKLGGVRAAAAWGAGAIARRVRARVAALTARDGDGDGEADRGGEAVTGGREVPPPAEFRAQLTRLVDRGVAIYAIYSGALGTRYNHEDQLFELCPELRGRIDRAYFPDANHSFTELEAQAALTRAVMAWFERQR